MRASLHRIYPVIALTLLAGATIWLERLTVLEPQSDIREKSGPDFIAENSRLIGFGANGMQRYELFAPHMEHFTRSNTTRIETPRLIMTSEGRELTVTAQLADISPEGKQVDLFGDVRARRAGEADRGDLTFASEHLRIWPDDSRAETDKPVVLTQGQSTATASGMKADNLFGQLELIGDATVSMPRRARNPS